jgi:hypothetical protein
MSLYADAAAGTLDQSLLQYYLNTSNLIDAPSTQPDETSGLTALALAAWEGHADVVQLLLDHGAAADALSSEHRTPLWIVTARGKGRERAKIVDMLLKKNANPKYSHPQLRNGSTPLENELRQLRDVGVIKLLVNANGLTSTAQELGKKIKNAKIIDAMMTSEDRKQIRAALVDVVMGLVLFIVAWANVIGAMANALLERFNFKGKKDGEVADNISKVPPSALIFEPELTVSCPRKSRYPGPSKSSKPTSTTLSASIGSTHSFPPLAEASSSRLLWLKPWSCRRIRHLPLAGSPKRMTLSSWPFTSPSSTATTAVP